MNDDEKLYYEGRRDAEAMVRVHRDRRPLQCSEPALDDASTLVDPEFRTASVPAATGREDVLSDVAAGSAVRRQPLRDVVPASRERGVACGREVAVVGAGMRSATVRPGGVRS
jgi:hypothetical protein